MGWMIVLFVGLGLVMFAGLAAVREHLWIKRAAFADGVIMELRRVGLANRRNPSYRPRVSFEADDGYEHTFTSPNSTRPSAYSLGQVVRVAYIRETGEGRIMSFLERFGGAVLFAAIGIGTMSAATTFLIGKELFARVYLK